MINKWHSWLAMPKFDRVWHENDLAEELEEYQQETKYFRKLGELSDVVYSCTRARWSGYKIDFPLPSYLLPLGSAYMFWKYTSRFLFFRQAGRRAGASKDIRCVRNPKKLFKLDQTLDEQKIKVNRNLIKKICEKQRKYWPLLP